MERDWRDFKALKNSIEGAREAFEKACESLIRKIHPDKNVQQIRVKLGDGGIDVYVGELGLEPITVYQCKFFLEEFNKPQQAQIRNSFNTAINSDKFELKNWVLCIPKVLDIDETIWWTTWKNKQIKLNNKDTQFITLINGNELIELMKTYGIYSLVFEIETLNLTREIHKNVTQLVESFDTKKEGLPSIKWSTFVGKQKWKNTPLIIGNSIFVGSAGNKWNKEDENDGIYCLNTETGSIKWVYQTYSDVNEISCFDGLIVGGCDNGSVHCISTKTGDLKWVTNLNSGVVSRIFKYAGYSEERLIITCYSGEICFLNLINGKVLHKIELEGHIMANIKFINESSQRILYIPTIEGILYELNETFDSFEVTSATTITYPDEHNKQTGYSKAELYSAPLFHDGKLFLGFARQTYYDYPAIVCLDAKSKNVLWYASDPSNKGSHFGNVRTNLLEDNSEIIFTHPYSNELIGLNKMTGEIKWVTKLGRKMFQQWASPIKNDNGYFLSRYDGYLYMINKSSKQRQWGMYLGQCDDAGIVFDSSQKVGNENEHAAWELFKGYPLISTPVLYNKNLIVGSDEGIIYCLHNV